jgi:hypothetical protein
VSQGLFSRSPDELTGRVHVFQRTFAGIDELDPATPGLAKFVDIAEGRLDAGAVALRRTLQEDMLPAATRDAPCRTTFAPLQWRAGGLDPGDAAHGEYLRGLLDGCCSALVDSLDQAQDRLAKEPDPLVDECRLHLAFAHTRSRHFAPTAPAVAVLERVEAYLAGGGGGALVVHGGSGSGKTYVMARAAARAIAAGRGAVAARFLGTSPASSTALGLLGSLCAQLRAVSAGAGRDAEGALPACPAGFDDLSQYLGDALRKWRWGPLAVFLDSVDQLDDANGGRRLDWLPVDGLAPAVHLVVSTLPDEPNPDVGRPFFCFSILTRRITRAAAAAAAAAPAAASKAAAAPTAAGDTAAAPAAAAAAANAAEEAATAAAAQLAVEAAAEAVVAGRLVEVSGLTEPAKLLEHLMQRHRRRLTPAQTAHVLDAAGRSGGAHTPLFLTLAAAQAAQWASNAAPAAVAGTVRLVILGFFRRLEAASGARMVEAAAAYVTLARQGVSEAELQGLLSLDDAVLSDVYQWCYNKP